MNLTGELRTPHYPHKCYPDHWGPFELHSIFPISSKLRALDAQYYQICVEIPQTGATYYLGFDDFAYRWPADGGLSPQAEKRRETIRDMAQFRALIQIKMVKHLSLEGVERLRDAGADVSDAACSEGLWVAVYGKYKNLPEFKPDPKVDKMILVTYIHQFERGTDERRLCLRSIDQRTVVRCMLYFERIKLRTFMINVSKEDNQRTPIEERDIEWFIKQYMDRYRFCTGVLPEKEDNYRNARKHTSEVRHMFVCHAEWMLRHADLPKGQDRVISESVLVRWAASAPAWRELAAKEGCVGWGVWDYVWDKVDPLEWYKKEKTRLRHFMNRIRRDAELAQDEDTRSDYESDRDRRKGQIRRPTKKGISDKGKGRAKSEDEYAHAWITRPSSIEEDDYASWDDEAASRAKRSRIDARSSLSLGGSQRAGPSSPHEPSRSDLSIGGRRESQDIGRSLQYDRTLGLNSSPSLGGQELSYSQPPTPARYFAPNSSGAGPSYLQNGRKLSSPRNRIAHANRSTGVSGLSRWAGGGLAQSTSSYSGAGSGRSSATNLLGEVNTTSLESRPRNRSTTGTSSVRFASSVSREIEASRLSQLSVPREVEIIVLSSDDDDIMVPVKKEPVQLNQPRSKSIDRRSVIEILDTTSEEDELQEDELREDELQEDDGGPGSQEESSAAEARASSELRRSTSQRLAISETPPRSRPQRTGRLDSHPLNTLSEEEISDSQESMNSSDSESKYGRKDRRASPTPDVLERRKIMELNRRILEFAPMIYYFPTQPTTWSPWKCNCPPLTLLFTANNISLARKYTCVFTVDLLRPTIDMQRLLSQSNHPIDAEFLKHLTTKPSVFTGPRDELARAIFTRVVELHREEHFEHWNVKQVIKEAENGLPRRVHFESR